MPPAGPPARLSGRAWDHAWRLAFRIGFPLARLWWRLRGAPHEGALVAVHVGPCLLVVRSSYRREWNFPGGGIHPDEAPVDAARRELAEEVGLHAPDLLPVGAVSGLWDGRPDRAHLFELHLDRLPELRLDNREVIGARLATPAELRTLPLTGPVLAYLGMPRDGAAGALPGWA